MTTLREKLDEYINDAEEECNELRSKLQSAEHSRDEMLAKMRDAIRKRDEARRERDEARIQANAEMHRAVGLDSSLTTVAAERDGLRTKLAEAEHARDELTRLAQTRRNLLDDALRERDKTQAVLTQATTAVTRWQAERDLALQERDGMRWDRDAAIARAEQMKKERDEALTRFVKAERKSTALETYVASLKRSRESSIEALEIACNKRDEAIACAEQAEKERDEARWERNIWRDRRDAAVASLATTVDAKQAWQRHSDLHTTERDQARCERDNWKARAERAEKERDELRAALEVETTKYNAMRQRRDQLAAANTDLTYWQTEREIALRERDDMRRERDAALARLAEKKTPWESYIASLETSRKASIKAFELACSERDAAVARAEQAEKEHEGSMAQNLALADSCSNGTWYLKLYLGLERLLNDEEEYTGLADYIRHIMGVLRYHRLSPSDLIHLNTRPTNRSEGK
jgi:hypothetical protein